MRAMPGSHGWKWIIVDQVYFFLLWSFRNSDIEIGRTYFKGSGITGKRSSFLGTGLYKFSGPREELDQKIETSFSVPLD